MQRGAAGSQRAPCAEDEEEATGAGGRQEAQAAVLPNESPREEGDDLQGFVPDQAYQLLVEVYGDHLEHNDGTHLHGGVVDDALWQRCWKRLVSQSMTR